MNECLLIQIRRSGLHQYQLAGRAEISETTLSRILWCRTEPTNRIKRRIAIALGVNVEDIFPKEAKNTSSGSQLVSVDLSEIIRALEILVQDGQVTEVRALDVSNSAYRRPHTESGYFDDFNNKLASAVERIPNARGVYFVLNPISPSLLARSENRIRVIEKDPLTTDSDILARRWLPVDLDPVRPSGISSTDEEHEAAMTRAQQIKKYLDGQGWPEPVYADSGNGAHLLYRIDLPTVDDELIRHCLDAIAFQWDDQNVVVDKTVFNPARIWKLYGTIARKGDHTSVRPHRMARLLETPDNLILVPKKALEELAATLPKEIGERTKEEPNGNPFNIDEWIAANNLEVMDPTAWRKGRRWIFEHCPWNENHTNRSAYIVQFDNGALAAGCHHNGCAGNDWHSLRDLVEPGWSDKQPTNKDDGNSKEKGRAQSAADRLSSYALESSNALFCDQFGQPHVLVDKTPIPLTSRCYKWLRRLMWDREKKAATGEALCQVAGTLAAIAETRMDIRELHSRSAYHNDSLYVQLSINRAVQIDVHGWIFVDSPPVLFRQFPNSRPLPQPEKGGNIETLVEMIPLKTERDQRLFVTYLTLGLLPHIPRPILQVTGPHGAGKTTLHRVVKRSLDPSAPESIRLDPREFLQKAFHSAVILIDNATYFPDWAVDVLCRLVTGEADSKRKLYSDDDDVIFELRNLVLINSINPPTNRPDFMDRCLCIDVERISDDRRISEKRFWNSFSLEHSRWLGSIFSLLSSAMKHHSAIQLPAPPRLVDWGEWAAAVYEAKGWGSRMFSQDWNENVRLQNRAVIDANSLIQVLLALMDQRTEWEGSPAELLNKIKIKADEIQLNTQHDRQFPKTENWLWRRIQEVRTVLQAQGIGATRDPYNDRKIIIRRVSPNA